MKQHAKFLLATTFAIFFTATYARAATWPAACGDVSEQFKVKTSKGTPPAPEADKALIVFVENLDDELTVIPTARFGVDGHWVGATRGNSYYAVSVAPGEHKLCASQQGKSVAEKDNVDSATVHLQAGQTYYYEFYLKKIIVGGIGRADGGAGGNGASPTGRTPDMTAREAQYVISVKFVPLDAEAAQRKLEKMPLSISAAK